MVVTTEFLSHTNCKSFIYMGFNMPKGGGYCHDFANWLAGATRLLQVQQPILNNFLFTKPWQYSRNTVGSSVLLDKK